MARTFPQVGIEIEARKRRERKTETWRRHEDALRLIREWVVPARLVNPLPLAQCRESFALERSTTVHDKYTIRSDSSCRQVPWCIPCTQAGAWARVRRAERRFAAWTPEGQPPRSIHAVFMAPLTVDGQGWGARAMQNIDAFFGVVDETLKAKFGAGIGYEASYQDFGEIPFTKSAPHVDLTLNGWKIDNDKIVPLEWDPEREKAELNTIYDEKATRFGFDARPGNSWMGPPRRGLRAARGALAYQMRELVDLRKVQYPAGSRQVGWQNYHDNSVDWMVASQFPRWYRSYVERVRPDEANRVHRKFGYMAARFSSTSMKLGFGGETPEHEEGCGCRECDAWERLVDAGSLFPALEGRFGRPIP